jgi:O-antigen ligase
MSVLMLLGIGREAIRETADFNRITFMGANANMIAIWAAAAIIIIVELCSRDILRWGNWRFALPILVLPLMIMIVQSGSRGGVISLGLGVVCFLFAPGLMGRRVMIGLGVLGILFGMFYLSKNSVLDERMQKTIETGSLAGREELWPEALRMVQEKPLLGWGMWNAADITEEAEAAPNGFLGELQGSDPHNVFLAFFVFGGALAGLPFLFMSGWWFYGTFAARHGPWGMLPFALTVFILSTMFKAGGFYLVKIPWILLAYATVVITTAAQSKPQQLSPRDRRAARKRVQEKTEIQKSES